jgi:hypothetical protein
MPLTVLMWSVIGLLWVCGVTLHIWKRKRRATQAQLINLTIARAQSAADAAIDDALRRRITQQERRQSVSEKEAQKVARKRLMASLTNEQRMQYEANGYFDVTSNLGTTFRLHADNHVGNIFQLPKGVIRTGRFCMHLSNRFESFPNEDHLLAQALMIRTDEVAFRRIACSL